MAIFQLPCSPDKDDLELELNNLEGAFVEIKAITRHEDSTMVEAEDVDELPAPVVVVEDPDEEAGLDDHELVCRGTACIDGEEVKVAVFRQSA